MPRYVEVEAPPEPESSKKKQNISNMNWLSQVQKSMTSSDTMEIKQLAGALYNAFKKIASKFIFFFQLKAVKALLLIIYDMISYK